MTYRYVLKWKTGEKAKVNVEAWPSSKRIALPHEKRKPSFVIGSTNGRRSMLLMSIIQDMKRKYEVQEKNGLYKIEFPFDDIEAIADVYRIGLAAEVVSRAKDENQADESLDYVLRSTTEEVWFWTSKLLGVVGSKMDSTKVLTALSILSNSTKKHDPNQGTNVFLSHNGHYVKYRLDSYL